MCLFYPDLLKDKITDITLTDLEKLGAQGLLLDVDNTLTKHNSQNLDREVADWIEMMKRLGIELTIVSNASAKRLEPFASRIGLKYVSRACKPLPFGFLRGAKRLGLPRKKCAVIGDQIFTDILGANLAGIPSIQVLPMELEKGHPFMMFKRRFERYILKSYRKKQQRANHGG